jgi:hypothetical protein
MWSQRPPRNIGGKARSAIINFVALVEDSSGQTMVMIANMTKIVRPIRNCV